MHTRRLVVCHHVIALAELDEQNIQHRAISLSGSVWTGLFKLAIERRRARVKVVGVAMEIGVERCVRHIHPNPRDPRPVIAR